MKLGAVIISLFHYFIGQRWHDLQKKLRYCNPWWSFRQDSLTESYAGNVSKYLRHLILKDYFSNICFDFRLKTLAEAGEPNILILLTKIQHNSILHGSQKHLRISSSIITKQLELNKCFLNRVYVKLSKNNVVENCYLLCTYFVINKFYSYTIWYKFRE